MKRVGARKGEVLEAWYKRAVDGEAGKERDVECWYLDREGCREENVRAWKERVERERKEAVEKREEEDKVRGEKEGEE